MSSHLPPWWPALLVRALLVGAPEAESRRKRPSTTDMCGRGELQLRRPGLLVRALETSLGLMGRETCWRAWGTHETHKTCWRAWKALGRSLTR